MPKPRFYLKKPHQSGETLIICRYFAKPRLLVISTGCKIEPRHWNPKEQRARKGAPDAEQLNAILERFAAEVTSAVLKLKADKKPITPENLRSILENKDLSHTPGKEIIPYILKTFQDRKSASVYTNLSNQVNAFTRRNRRGRTFEEIDSLWFRDFQKFLLSQDLANSYCARLLTALKTVVKSAVLDKAAQNAEILLSPIGVTSEPAGGIVLTIEEVEALKEAGTPIAVISEAMGHSSVTVTDIYLKSFGSDTINETDKLL